MLSPRLSRLLVLLLLLASAAGFFISQDTLLLRDLPSLNVDDFPPDFILGAGTSAYQVEGAIAEDGKSPSIWDTFAHAGNVVDKSNADVSVDQYHKYKEDVKLMSDVGLDAYRFSISWPRLIPNGRGVVNPKGLQYYNNLINELIQHDIQPLATLYQFDLPQILEDEYGGWLSPEIVVDFTAYADVCFREFGDRVGHWTTINQPNIMAISSYDNGFFPPRRCTVGFGFNCTGGNSSVEPYIAAHHTLLAHASAAALYRQNYQAKQKGLIGMNFYGMWFIPFSNSTADVQATQRVLDFYNGWILNPLVFGDYPEIMRKNAGSRLPSFTKSESQRVKGSYDFIGLNHYITGYAQDDPDGPKRKIKDFDADIDWNQIVPTSTPTTPFGLQALLEYLKDRYGNPPVYIQENGKGLPFNETLNDTARVEYISGYINATLNAIRNGANVKGYIMWSFLDVFEFLSGYLQRYGLYHVDFEDEALTRQPKLSARWYSNLLKKKNEARIRKIGQQSNNGHPIQ
ncbi:Cyanidin 3-O-glucoside 7-O-glucosyltransferase (acyl-glucose) [Asimina triloba]